MCYLYSTFSQMSKLCLLFVLCQPFALIPTPSEFVHLSHMRDIQWTVQLNREPLEPLIETQCRKRCFSQSNCIQIDKCIQLSLWDFIFCNGNFHRKMFLLNKIAFCVPIQFSLIDSECDPICNRIICWCKSHSFTVITNCPPQNGYEPCYRNNWLRVNSFIQWITLFFFSQPTKAIRHEDIENMVY